MLLSIEAFGGNSGATAAMLNVTSDVKEKLLILADAFRAVANAFNGKNDPKLLRMVFIDTIGTQYYVDDGTNDEIGDFVQDASGVKFIISGPGESNMRLDDKTIHVTFSPTLDNTVCFLFSGNRAGYNERIETVRIEENIIKSI